MMRKIQGSKFWIQNWLAWVQLKAIILFILPFLLGVVISCSAQRVTKPYAEDLSAYRQKFDVRIDTSKKVIAPQRDRAVIKPTKNINAKLDAILDSIDKQNLQKKFVDGFTIQIYSGQSKEDAMTAKQKVVEELTDFSANLQYLQPKFRLSIGSYFSKLEAQKDLVKLKSYFPGAILVPEKIQIR
jgi:hypothetical protein